MRCHVAELVVPDVSEDCWYWVCSNNGSHFLSDIASHPRSDSLTPHNKCGYCACSITTVTKFLLIHFMNSSMMWWDTEDIKNVYKQWSGNMKGAEHLEDVNMRIILEWILKKHGVNRIWPRIRSSVGLLWISNEHLNATESKEFLDWVSDLVSYEGLCGWDRQDELCQPSDLLITCNRPRLPTNVVRLLNSKAYIFTTSNIVI